jgi:Arc/MetJ-type ribon-helix-helix transcriptional regulator
MTASVARRRRRAMAGATVSFALVLVAAGLTFVGATTIANSNVGAVVQGDVRPVILLPQTDNAALAVVDDDNRLTALIVATLLPGGEGGSIVTIPVDADASIGLGDERRPLAGVLDPADPDNFFEAVEGTLAIVLQFGEIVGADRLAELIEPVTPVSVDLPFVPASAQLGDVPQSSATTTTEVVRDELADLLQSTDFDVTAAVDVLRSTPLPGTNADRQTNTFAMWSAFAAATPVDAADDVPVDEFGLPVTASTIDDVFSRLWQGPVQVRDLAVVSAQSSTDGNEAAVSVLDRFDSLLVFAQISPARVSKPNVGLVFRVEVPITDVQLNVESSPFANRSDVARSALGQLLFLQANVASVDVAPSPEGAPTKTRVEVADEKFVADLQKSLSPVFGDAEYVVSEQLIAGIDVVMTIGTGYFDAFKGVTVASSEGDADTVVADG